MDYNKPYRYSTYGLSGRPGSDGSDSWGDGENGGNGDHGPTLDVFVNAYFDEILKIELIEVEVFNQSGNKNYLIKM